MYKSSVFEIVLIMEPNQPIQPIAPQPQSSQPSLQTISPIPKQPSKLPVFLLTLVSLLSISGLVYFYLQTISLKKQIAIEPAPTPTTNQQFPLPISTTNPTADWKTYMAPSKPKTAIQYPTDWKVDEKYITDDNGKYLFSYTVAKGEYSITFSFPSGFGPGVCIFKDQPEFSQELEPGPGSTKCPGDFVEIKSATSIFRRLATPPKKLEDGTIPEWGIYTRDNNGNYVTVPPITYKVPEITDVTQIEIMDQILSTFEPQK